MNMKRIILGTLLLTVLGCSEDIKILEERIKAQADRNNTEISVTDIKKTALFLDAWGKEDYYQEDINKFKDQDLINFPEDVEVLFTGSSSIRFWNSLEEDMRPLKVLNRGFGGAHIVHVNYHFEDVVSRYNPQAIVFFCGTNDITALKTAKETVEDFKIFQNKVRTNLPNVPIFVIGIKPTPAREYIEEEELEYNKLIADLAAEDELLSFIDIWDAMLSEEGERIPELFVEDGLHINAKGYEIWTKLVRENLKQRFNL
jgi:hypothetical protein